METSQPNDEQSALWNGPSGRAWVDTQAPIDRMFEPLEKLLVDAAATSSARSVLDVGCGTGAVTLAIARRLGADVQCTGIDISSRMIDAAQARAARSGVRARFVRADVQTHAFERERRPDRVAPRCDVLRRSGSCLRESAACGTAECADAVHRMAQRGRQSVHDDRRAGRRAVAAEPARPAARRAGAIRVRRPAARCVGAVGQRLGGHRDRAGRSGVRAACFRAGRLHLAAGPVGLALLEVDEATRRRVVDTMRAAFAPYVEGADVRFDAACWLVTARAPSA